MGLENPSAAKRQELYERACRGGDGAACHTLIPYAKDATARREMRARSCALGNPDACTEQRELTRLDTEAKTSRPACERGDAQACFRVGAASLEAMMLVHETGRYAEVYPLFARACAGGSAAGCRAQGEVLAAGHGVAKDEKAAASLFARACAAGDAAGCADHASALRFGDGTAVDARAARAAAQRGCDLGHARACAIAAELFWEGTGGAPDRALAVRLFETACGRGSDDSCEDLLQRMPEGVPLDAVKRGIEILSQRAKSDPLASFHLRLLQRYFRGGNPVGTNLAKRCAEGSADACSIRAGIVR
jgi:TPR repeat protein